MTETSGETDSHPNAKRTSGKQVYKYVRITYALQHPKPRKRRLKAALAEPYAKISICHPNVTTGNK